MIDFRYRIKRRDELHERIVSEHDPVSADLKAIGDSCLGPSDDVVEIASCELGERGCTVATADDKSITHVMGHSECALPRLATPGEPIC